MVGHLGTNFLSLPQHKLFLMPLFGKAWESLHTVHTWTSLCKVWTYAVQNIRSFLKSGISRFKQVCPFCNMISDCHILSVQNAIIPLITFSNCFFIYLIFSVKYKKNENKAEEECLANCVNYSSGGISDKIHFTMKQYNTLPLCLNL